jgi:hypothetical protein
VIWVDYFLALNLLTAPPEAAMQGDLRHGDAFRVTLQRVCIHLEILDRREVRYVLMRREEYTSDLNLLRRRYQDLVDAPSLHDCERFPSREAINELLSFNRAYRQYLGSRQPVDLARWWEFRIALQETDHLYHIWDTLRDARCPYYYVTVRRRALKKLREVLGDDAYYKGQLPPHVPFWRFQEID